MIILVVLLTTFGVNITVTKGIDSVLLTTLIVLLAYMLSFTFKMIIGLVAFWTTEIRGLYNFVDIILLTFAGYIMPVTLLIHPLEIIAGKLPFVYMIYYPITAIQEKYNLQELINIIGMQIGWLMLFLAVYHLMWKSGLKKFSGVGQ